jgi:hypothetical protein
MDTSNEPLSAESRQGRRGRSSDRLARWVSRTLEAQGGSIAQVRPDREFSATPARSALASRFGWRETPKEPRLTLSAHFGVAELSRLNSHHGFTLRIGVADTSWDIPARGWLAGVTPCGTASEAFNGPATKAGSSSISSSVSRTAENDSRAWMMTGRLQRVDGLFWALIVGGGAHPEVAVLEPGI